MLEYSEFHLRIAMRIAAWVGVGLLVVQAGAVVVCAQTPEQRGTVKADALAVYEEMSADRDAVATLARGTVVHVTLSVTNGDGSWCGVSSLETNQKLGYVHCEGLERENAPGTAVTGGGGLAATPGPSAAGGQQKLTRAQKQWVIAASAILATYNRESMTTMASGGGGARKRALLSEWWDIHSREDLLNALAWIEQSGHRQAFSVLGQKAAQTSPEELKAVLNRLNAEDANSVRVAHRYYEQWSTQSITGWDFARYINVCRWGVEAGYLTEDEAWPRALYAARILQQTFGSWRELGENYLVGREFWSLHQMQIDGAAMRAVVARLLADRGSIWNQTAWNAPLG